MMAWVIDWWQMNIWTLAQDTLRYFSDLAACQTAATILKHKRVHKNVFNHGQQNAVCI